MDVWLCGVIDEIIVHDERRARRDRFKTVGMEAGIPTLHPRRNQGHAPSTAAERYGRGDCEGHGDGDGECPGVEV